MVIDHRHNLPGHPADVSISHEAIYDDELGVVLYVHFATGDDSELQYLDCVLQGGALDFAPVAQRRVDLTSLEQPPQAVGRGNGIVVGEVVRLNHHLAIGVESVD
jgi:hypothetical protein